MGKHAEVAPVGDVGRRVLRTIIQVGIPAVLGLVVIIPDVIGVIDEQVGAMLPAGFRAWMLGAAVLLTATSAAVARIMAMQSVNAWLSRWTPFGAGSPQSDDKS